MSADPKPTPELSMACSELLHAMKTGTVVHGMFGFHSYYFRADTMKKCTVQVEKLLLLGLAKQTRKDWRGCIVVPADAAQPAATPQAD
jgi:hypothetical protein